VCSVIVFRLFFVVLLKVHCHQLYSAVF
jgi:hypothetical protein